jgi:hypothetical protein
MQGRKPMTSKTEGARFQLRLLHELLDWIRKQATTIWTSANAEIIRAIRSRMEAEQPNAVG